MTSFTRPNWDDTWLAVARVVAQRSLCDRDKVGAVIVAPNMRIVSTGYNGPPHGYPHGETGCTNWCLRKQRSELELPDVQLEKDYSDCPSLHAEANALSVCDRSVRVGGTIYVTSNMCMGCAKLVANSGLVNVVIDDKAYSENKHRNSEESYRFLEKCGITVVTG